MNFPEFFTTPVKLFKIFELYVKLSKTHEPSAFKGFEAFFELSDDYIKNCRKFIKLLNNVHFRNFTESFYSFPKPL